MVNAPVLNELFNPTEELLYEQEVAFVEVQLIVELPLYETDDGEAETETVGGETQIDPFQAVPDAQPAVALLWASC